MPTRLLSALVCTLCLHAFAATADLWPAQAVWLSHQLNRPVEASQILVAPDSSLEGCTITRAHFTSTGATALSLRCPASFLPYLVLITGRAGAPHLPQVADVGLCGHPHQSTGGPNTSSIGACGAKQLTSLAPQVTGLAPASPAIVHAGAALRADWHTDFIHAQLPAVALDSGPAGAEIRVRIPQTNRIVRARILGPHAVAILVTGA